MEKAASGNVNPRSVYVCAPFRAMFLTDCLSVGRLLRRDLQHIPLAALPSTVPAVVFQPEYLAGLRDRVTHLILLAHSGPIHQEGGR